MLHDILKDFKGSQDGRFCEQFTAGTQADLSDYLADIVVREGWARPVKVVETTLPLAVLIDNKAIVTDGGTAGIRRRK